MVDMDRYAYLFDQQHRFLLIGIVLFVMAGVFTLAGASLQPHGPILYRAEKPKRFWWNVTFYCLTGLFFIGLFLYQND